MHEEKLQILMSNFEVNEAARSCISMIKHSTEQKGIYVRFKAFSPSL